jgi:nucleolar protein 14
LLFTILNLLNTDRMGKSGGTKQKRSMGSLPKGLVHRKGSTPADPGNPFEVTARMKRPKYQVHNRPLSKPKSTKHALESLQRRQGQLRSTLKSSKKANVLVDKRIGEYDPSMSSSDQMLARLVKERTRQSQRSSKFRLDDNNDDLLTHKGQKLDPNRTETLYSDDEDDYGNLEAVDTELHFGGDRMKQTANPYGGSSSADLAQVYGQRKTELDDLIARRKTLKAEKMQAKETQVETVEKLDEDFAELSNLLLFRKDQPRSTKKTVPTEEEREMNEWNTEMKQMMFKPKLRATDRTKTPEEIAKEEANRLHEMETRRIARMRGDFADDDDLSDISLDGVGKRKKSKRRTASRNPEELSDSEGSDAEVEKLEARFTPDGLKYVDRDGNIVEKDQLDAEDEVRSGQDDSEDETDGKSQQHPLPKGTKVLGNYRAGEQFDGREAWYDGEITKVHILKDGSVRYDLEYLVRGTNSELDLGINSI